MLLISNLVWFLLSACGAPASTGCGGCGAGEREVPNRQVPGAGEQASQPVPARPPPALGVKLEATENDCTLVLENRSSELVSLKKLVQIRDSDGAAVAALELRYDCEVAANPCVELVPGAEFRPPPWLYKRGEAQCECRGCEPAGAGTYRFWLEACDGAYRLGSEPFSLP